MSASLDADFLAGASSGTGRARAFGRLWRQPQGAIGLVFILTMLFVAVLADTIRPGNPLHSLGPGLHPPSLRNPMGTDISGRDVLGGVVHGTRTSMLVVAWVLGIALVVGIGVGLLSGYRGGLLDDALMRLTELFQVVPRFFLVLLVLAVFGRGLDRLIIVLGLTSWTVLARVVRAETLSLRQREFVEVAKSVGSSPLRIVTRHLLPNLLGPVTVVGSLLASRIILLEAMLSFLGLGPPNRYSLGLLASEAQGLLEQAWWLWFFPGVAIAIAVLGFNLLGDGLNAALDPTLARPARLLASRERGVASRWRRQIRRESLSALPGE